MKEWWFNLNLREKQMVSMGAAIIILGLLYVLIWSPLKDSVTTMRDQVQQNQSLLNWMQTADEQIQAAEQRGQKPMTVQVALLI